MSHYGMFLLQVLTLVAGVGLVVALVSRRRSGAGERTQLLLEDLNERYRKRHRRVRLEGMASAHRKGAMKAYRREDKQRLKAAKGDEHEAVSQPNVWVLEFQGDLRASATTRLGEEISALLGAAEQGDEVVLQLESAGGLVHAYGLASAQLDRLRHAGLTLTVCVDKVAASGGYMMACCANRIQVAPFAVLGSIGVVAQLPNVNRLLKRHDIDVEIMTAGRYKRTLTVFGENTEEGREKFSENLENTHHLFKTFVAERRPGVDIEAVSTGEIWYGSQAIDNGLADQIGTCEGYLLERMKTARVIKVKLESRRSFGERLGVAVSHGVERAVERTLEALDATRWLRR
nr:protease SohB [Halomonas populi]